MPLYEFICNVGHVTEELFTTPGEAPEDMPCPAEGCGCTAKRRQVYRTRVVGPVFEHMEHMERVLLSPRERAAGVRLRGQADIAARERAMGIQRTEEYDARVAHEDMKEQAIEDREVLVRDGPAALAARRVEQTIKDETGWDDSQYHRWKDISDAVERDAPAEPSAPAA